jgi:hypothetical protein
MKKSILFALMLLISCRLFAQNEIVKDGELPEAEMHVAINPLDSNNIIVAVMKGYANDTFSRIVIYRTINFGNTWEKSLFNGKLPDTYGSGDPVLSFDRNGRCYLVSLTLSANNISSLISWSDDKGSTWQKKPLLSNVDKPWLAIDCNPNSPYVDRKYIPLTYFDDISNDIKCMVLDANDNLIVSSSPVENSYNFEQLTSVAVQADGDVFVGYYVENSNGTKALNVSKSSDGAMTFDTEVRVAYTTADIFSSITGIEERLNLAPYLAIDKSNGLFHNRIYYSYTDNEAGANTLLDIYLAWSDDDGATWTTPKKVVDNAISMGSHQFYSSIYVTETGTLLLGWYDRRDDANEDRLTDFFVGVSLDGGATFQETKVTTQPSDFEQIGLNNAGFGIGDYGQIVATNHTALPFWSDGRSNDGDLNVYFARIPFVGLPVGVKEISTITDQISMGQPFPIPAVDKISFSLKLKKSGRFVVKLVSTDGKIVYTSEQKELLAGENVVSVPVLEGLSGSLFLSVEGDLGFLRTVKVR